MAYFRNDRANIYYEIHGNGIPLLMNAGLASDSQSWAAVVPELSKNYRLILPDNRGSGRTNCRVDQVSIGKMADDVVALMDHLGLEKVSLLGHSMGGMVTMRVAMNDPQRINNLILVDTALNVSQRTQSLLSDWVKYRENNMPMEQWFRNLFYWIFSTAFFESPDFVAENVKFAVDYPYPQTTAQFRAQVETLCRFEAGKNELGELNCPILVLAGEADILFPEQDRLNLLQHLPRARQILIRKAAHSVFMEQPEAFVKAVVEFLG